MQLAKTILYVDDDKDDREIFEEIIRELHPEFTCILADGASEALQILTLPPPPLCIFIDINMPKISGIELLKSIRSTEQFKNIPIFMLTTSREHEKQTRALGATDYFQKPNTFHGFFDLMKACSILHDLKQSG
jgi:CheY-like chemotaxis protein